MSPQYSVFTQTEVARDSKQLSRNFVASIESRESSAMLVLNRVQVKLTCLRHFAPYHNRSTCVEVRPCFEATEQQHQFTQPYSVNNLDFSDDIR